MLRTPPFRLRSEYTARAAARRRAISRFSSADTAPGSSSVQNGSYVVGARAEDGRDPRALPRREDIARRRVRAMRRRASTAAREKLN